MLYPKKAKTFQNCLKKGQLGGRVFELPEDNP